MSEEEVVLKRATEILWDNGFTIGSIMHLLRLTRKQVREYLGFKIMWDKINDY